MHSIRVFCVHYASRASPINPRIIAVAIRKVLRNPVKSTVYGSSKQVMYVKGYNLHPYHFLDGLTVKEYNMITQINLYSVL